MFNFLIPLLWTPLFKAIKKELHMSTEAIVAKINAQGAVLDKVKTEVTGLVDEIAALKALVQAETLDKDAINAALDAVAIKVKSVDDLVVDTPVVPPLDPVAPVLPVEPVVETAPVSPVATDTGTTSGEPAAPTAPVGDATQPVADTVNSGVATDAAATTATTNIE